MLELGTRHDGGLANDFTLARRRRMMGLARGVTVSTLGAPAGPIARSGIVRGDIRRGFGTANGVARGVPLDIRVRLTSATSGRPLAGHAVYLWHCDRDGNYSLRSPGLENENYLRGMQATDSAGWVRFTSIFPGSHEGAWPRLHVEVYRSVAAASCPATRLHAAEIMLPADACVQAHGTAEGHPGATVMMACVTGDVRRGLVATRTMGI
ncbi:hypothetical protein ACIA5D_00395 [Actinoplanes sp. NPDC051513]|uniref:dioxygenase family protein n=1 Tax=Actinoplanes sp. NPDC051513 TaxID=3363908 RepID=UPI003796F648